MILHKVALNIYNKPWLIEPQSAMNLLDMWEKIMSNQTTFRAEMEEGNELRQEFKQLFAKSDIVFAPDNYFDAKTFSGFEGATVAVIPVMGAMMKNDFCGSFGTAALANMVRLAENTPSVKVIASWIDSPGGTVDGTATFASAIKSSKKQTVAITDGISASAAYWYASSHNEVIATSKTDILGSIGTMVSWRDWSKADEQRGLVLREYYATDSTDKNRSFREANAGDGRMLIAEILDPLNDEFTGAVKANRKGKLNLEKENVLSGKTYIAGKAKENGLIDSIMPFEKAIQRALMLAKTIK